MIDWIVQVLIDHRRIMLAVLGRSEERKSLDERFPYSRKGVIVAYTMKRAMEMEEWMTLRDNMEAEFQMCCQTGRGSARMKEGSKMKSRNLLWENRSFLLS